MAHIEGHVQGVGFRYYTQLKAEQLGIRGWVRNLSDGSVESYICGDVDQIQNMQCWFTHGPSGANVTNVEYSSSDLAEQQQDFSVRY